MSIQKRLPGFTIVELLIVIIVIAILATISIVAYNGIQQRATNASIVSAANQSIKLISAYITTNNDYPYTSGATSCLVSGKTSCSTSSSVSSSSTLINNLATLGNLPSSVPDVRTEYNGITYSYAASGRTVDSSPLHLVLLYSLLGTNQQCGVSNILAGTWNTFNSSTTGYTSSAGGYTLCIAAVPGP